MQRVAIQWLTAGAFGFSLVANAWGQPGPAPTDPTAAPEPGRSPLNSRDEVWQTAPPRPGYYEDIPRRPGDHRPWHPGAGGNWGPGPQWRPGHPVQRLPDRYWVVPYAGRDYFYSDGYWYRPQGSGYTVVLPPQGRPTQQTLDIRGCERWAVSQSGFDPNNAPYAPAAGVVRSYQRALGDCLEQRGYRVR